MDKKLLAHEKYVNNAIKTIEHQLKEAESADKTKLKQKIEKLNDYHQIVVHDLQHERLIHLIVTFFFAGLLLVSIGALFMPALIVVSYDYSLMSTLILVMAAILSVLDVFYIIHYFNLENGVQRLYKLSEKLHELTIK